MTKITKTLVAMNGLVSSLTKLINEWKPGDLTHELKYRDSLMAFMCDNMPSDCAIEKEYRHNGTTTDLFLRWKGVLFNEEVFIEVKRNLNKKTTLDRLVGQLESLQPGKRSIVVVLVGETDEALLKRLKAKYESCDGNLCQPLEVVVK
jgi:hypothetical protein